MKSMLEKINVILLPIVSALAGILAGVLLEWWTNPLIEDQHRALVTLVTFSVVCTLCGMLFVSINSSHTSKEVKRVRAQQDELRNRFGVTARLLTYGTPTSEYRNTFEYPTQLLKSAREIIAVDYKEAQSSVVVGDQDAEYVQWYANLTKFAQQKGITYKRMIQLKGGAREIFEGNLGFNPTEIDHFKALLKCQDNNRDVLLMTCPVMLSHVCFLIIDNQYVIWEVPYIEGEDVFRFEMDLVVEDPVGVFVGDLKRQIDHMMVGSQKVIRIDA